MYLAILLSIPFLRSFDNLLIFLLYSFSNGGLFSVTEGARIILSSLKAN